MTDIWLRESQRLYFQYHQIGHQASIHLPILDSGNRKFATVPFFLNLLGKGKSFRIFQ